MLAYFLFVAVIDYREQQPLPPDEVVASIRQMNAWIDDVAFDWEIRTLPVDTTDDRANGRLRAGHYRYRPSDGALWIELYDHEPDGEKHKWSMSYSAGVKRTLFEDLKSGAKNATMEQLTKRWRFEDGDLPWYIVYLPYFTDLSTQETPLEFIGWEKQSGHRCAHLAVYEIGGIREAGRHLWIDLERGGHPLRVELRVIPDVPRAVMKDIVVEEIPSPDGNKVWFPVRGTAETIVEGRVGYRAALTVTAETIRFNQGLADRDFDVAVPANVAVSDLNKQTLARPGSSELPARPRQIPTVVKDTIRRAEVQKSAIQTRSRARQRVSWATVGSWGLTATAVVLLATVLYLRRVQS